MSSDYEHYRAGCRSESLAPFSAWRFHLLYGGYQRTRLRMEPDPHTRPASSPALERHAGLVRLGREIAATARPDEPGTVTSGVREPRVPFEPVLSGCAARPLPAPDAPDQSFWRT